MVLQVHDEVVLEVPEKEEAEVVRLLAETLTYKELLVPFTVSISTGKNWGQMEELVDKQTTKINIVG